MFANLNPIVNPCFEYFKVKVRAKEMAENCTTLVSSMPRRIQSVIKDNVNN